MAEMTEKQRIVYGLKKKLIPTSHIAKQLNISTRMVRLHYAEARRKVQGGVPTLPPTKAEGMLHVQPMEKFECHGMQISITILNKRGQNKTGQIKRFEGCYAHVNPNTIDLYQAEGTGKRSDTIDAAFSADIDYLYKIIEIIEKDTNYLLIKPRSENIRLTKYHIADRENQISNVYYANDAVLRVQDSTDGKQRFVVDWSEGKIPHFEAVHPQKAKPDMKRINNTLNQIADGYPTPSEAWDYIRELLKQQKHTTENIDKISIALLTILPKPQLTTPQSQKKIDEYVERIDYIG